MLCVLRSAVLSSLSVALGTGKSTFSAAVDKTGRIYVEGTVRQNTPYLTKIGGFDVDLSVQGSVLLCRQRDQPGIVGSVGMALAKGSINISFMTVCRTTRNEEAIMAIGIDDEPTKEVRSTQRWDRVHHDAVQSLLEGGAAGLCAPAMDGVAP
jgi:D-3-phosphoglycerate dehydrogenase